MSFEIKNKKDINGLTLKGNPVAKKKESKSIEKNDFLNLKFNEEFISNLASKIELLKDQTSKFLIGDIPTHYLPYPKGSRIIASTYPYRIIKTLSDSKLPLDYQYELMLQGIETENFDKRQLSLFDFMYINVLRKMSSLPAPIYSVPYYCNKCKETNVHRFGFSDLTFDDLDLDKIKSLPIEIDFYTIGKQKFSTITIDTFMKILKNDLFYLKDEKGEYILDGEGNKVKDKISILAGHCVSLPFREAYDLFSNVNVDEDITLLEQVDSLLGHRLSPLKIKCTTNKNTICGNTIYIGLSGGESIIIPFRGYRGTIEDRINFG